MAFSYFSQASSEDCADGSETLPPVQDYEGLRADENSSAVDYEDT